MKSVLISIQPKWVEKIANGEKTIEVRKTRPKIETPFKCDIYMTQGDLKDLGSYSEWIYQNRMKVIGEFICNNIDDFSDWEYGYPSLLRHINLYAGTNGDYAFLNDYLKGKKKGYGWHISELKIYDKPKELNEFQKPCKMNLSMCDRCEYYYIWSGHCENITRPPQSWCYVEEV